MPYFQDKAIFKPKNFHEGPVRIMLDWTKEWSNKLVFEVVMDELKERLNGTSDVVIVFLTRQEPYPYMRALIEHRWGWTHELLIPDPPPQGITDAQRTKVWRENYSRRDRIAYTLGIHHLIFFCLDSPEKEREHVRWRWGLHGKVRQDNRLRVTLVPPVSLMDLLFLTSDKKVPYIEELLDSPSTHTEQKGEGQ